MSYKLAGYNSFLEKRKEIAIESGIDLLSKTSQGLGDNISLGGSLSDNSIDFNQTSFVRVFSGQDMQTDNFVSGSAGWQIQGNGNVEFNDGTFRGALSASTIDIGGSDATSFHVDIDGNMWLGAATFDISTNPFAVSNAGVLRSVSGTIGGFTLSATTITATNLTFTSGVANTANITVGTGATAGGINSAAGGGDIIFWGGDTFANRATAEYRVTANGDLVATSATINGLTFAGDPIFGDGNDGTVTIAANTTLTTDVFYNVLTVNATFTLNPSTFRIFVRTTCTVSGTIGRLGALGGNGGNGGDGAAGAAGGAGGTAGVGGGAAGGAGGTGGNSGAGVAGAAGANATAGTSVTSSLGVAGVAGGAGNAGAAGGAGQSAAGAGGAAGTTAAGGTVTAPTDLVRNLCNAQLMLDTGASPPVKYTGSAGSSAASGAGGGGGGGGDAGAGRNGGGGGGSGASGGPGTNGGIFLLAARTITINIGGSISSTAGAGGTGGNGGNGGGGDTLGGQTGGGGGGQGGRSGTGGQGGVIVLIYQSFTNNGTLSVAAGAAGAGGTAGTGGTGLGGGANGTNGTNGVAGTAGTAGVIIQLTRT